MKSNTIGDRIRELRELKGLSQADLAKALFVKRETVNQWENNSRDLKTDYTIKLADFFEVTADYLLRGVSAENVDINKRLGLTDEAISVLEEHYKYSLAINKKANSFCTLVNTFAKHYNNMEPKHDPVEAIMGFLSFNEDSETYGLMPVSVDESGKINCGKAVDYFDKADTASIFLLKIQQSLLHLKIAIDKEKSKESK